MELTETLEKPKLEQVEWFDDRYYRVTDADGNETFYPSVTTILGIINKPFLSRWRGDIGNEEADRRMNYAAWRGSTIHDAIHIGLSINSNGDREPLTMFDADGKKIYEQDEWIQILRFGEFWQTFKPELLFSELKVCSHATRHAGTCDLICKLKAGEYTVGRSTVEVLEDGIYIGDLKTGKQIDDEYHFQTAAYADSVRGMGIGDPRGSFIIHTNAGTKNGWSVALRTKPEMDADFNLFLAAKSIFDRKNENAQPKVFTMPTTIQL